MKYCVLRLIFGPLHFYIATFESYIANIWMSWELLLLAEISIVKALLSNRFSLVMRIDENFAGRFLLRFNLGYLLISQTGRFVHIFFYFVFNWGGIYPGRVLDKEARPNPFMVAWMTNVLTSPDLYMELVTKLVLELEYIIRQFCL